MAQYCPLLGQLFAIAGHKVMRREKIFGRSTIAIRNMLSGCRKRGFAREKPYSQFYPSPFTFSPETPINTGVVRGEGLAQPFTTLHLITKLIHHLCIELVIIDDRTVVYKLPIGNSKTEVTATSRRVAERIPIVGKRLRVYTLHNSKNSNS